MLVFVGILSLNKDDIFLLYFSFFFLTACDSPRTLNLVPEFVCMQSAAASMGANNNNNNKTTKPGLG